MSNYDVLDEKSPVGRCLMLRTEWHDRYKSLLGQKRIDTLRLSKYMGWCDASLEFLSGLTSLKGVEVTTEESLDATPIYALEKLEYLHLDSKLSREFDVSRIARLRFLTLAWAAKLSGVEFCTGLKMLSIRGFPDLDLHPYSALTALEDLTITSRKITSFGGIVSFIYLRNLTVNHASKLVDLSGVECLSALERVCFNRCKAFGSLPCLGGLENLESLILEDCGNIESLSFLSQAKKMKKLRRLLLIGDTKVVDGDMSPILKLPNITDIRLHRWKHYSHTREDLLRELGLPIVP